MARARFTIGNTPGSAAPPKAWRKTSRRELSECGTKPDATFISRYSPAEFAAKGTEPRSGDSFQKTEQLCRRPLNSKNKSGRNRVTLWPQVVSNFYASFAKKISRAAESRSFIA